MAVVALLAALALRRAELAIVAAPFALLLVIGTRLAEDPHVRAELATDRERTLEGDELASTVTVSVDRPVDRLELLLDLPPDMDADELAIRAVRVPGQAERTLTFRLRCRRWGVFELGDVAVRATDVFRLVVWERRFSHRRRVKVYPRPLPLRRTVVPADTQAFTGSEVSRAKGDGIEYADIRDFAPGDRVRSINWRASARRQALVVNQRHPERNTDVVLLVDSFVDVRRGERSVLEQAVRAGAALATRYLERHDRVGLVGFGGVVRWLRPGMGATQRYRLIETMLETDVEPTYTWRDISLVPSRVLPPKALVLALTPLVDPRFVAALGDLRARRFDVAVVEVDPAPLVEPAAGVVEQLAYRLWLLEREVLRARLARLGIGIARWGDGELETALEEVRTYRRHALVRRV